MRAESAAPPPDAAARPRRSRLVALAAATRPHQWAKNALVFVPLLGAHRLGDVRAWWATATAFVVFSVVASAGYVLNDLLDVEADRRHPRKRLRPFASGALPPVFGVALVPALLLGAGALATLLPLRFGILVGAYFAATVAYSTAMKRWVAADVVVLASLYTARIFAGAFATGIPVSEWLASFSMFLFLSLAFLKRGSELVAGREALPGRGYRPEDREGVFTMGIAAGYLSVLVLALYVSSHEIRRLYASAGWLWGLCPLVLYWVSRIWMRARRGEIEDDPLVFALKDPATWVVGALAAAVVVAGSRAG